MAIDLTGGEVRVIGNCGDKHLFRLGNPVDQDIITSDSEYEIKFTKKGRTAPSNVDLDTSEIDDGVLIFSVVIASGVYVVRRLEPRRTILTMEVEGR